MTDQKNDVKKIDHHQKHVIYTMMRQLQEHVRSNIPAMIAQRSLSSFSLSEADIPLQAKEQVLVIVYPQDPFVGEPEVRRMSINDIRDGLVNSRVFIDDSLDVLAQPDENGNYMFLPGTVEFDQVNAFYYTTFTLRMYERYAGRSIPWSFASARIRIDPHAGSKANAFYDEQNQLLGFQTFKHDGTELSTAQSADIVSHEAAHAILDGIRDLYNESFGLGARAFHESFSDITTVLVALHDDSLIRRLLNWTDGNLRMTTFISEVAERLVQLMQHGGDYISEHTFYLRNAFNQFQHVPFDDLPFATNDPMQLSRQEHNYSRLFSGAFYDILVAIYEMIQSEGVSAYIAIYKSRDIVGRLLMTAIEAGPVGELTFADMAKSFISADDILYNGKYSDVIKSVFDQRQILSTQESDEYLQYIQQLPDIHLPPSINSWLASVQYLEDVILPALQLEPQSQLTPLATHRNADGNVFMTYFSARSIRLQGQEYGQFSGTRLDLMGGLTLMFDRNNRLRSVCYRPVNDEDVRQIRMLVSDMIQAGEIVDQLYVSHQDMLYQKMPQGLFIGNPILTHDDLHTLVKYPVIFDVVPEETMKFQEYLNKWGGKSED